MTGRDALRVVAVYARTQEQAATYYRHLAAKARERGDRDGAASLRAMSLACDGAAAGARFSAKDVLAKLREAGL